MSFREQDAIRRLGGVESHGGGVLMEVEYSGRRSDQPHPWARWRTSGELTETGDVSTGGGDAILMMNGETRSPRTFM